MTVPPHDGVVISQLPPRARSRLAIRARPSVRAGGAAARRAVRPSRRRTATAALAVAATAALLAGCSSSSLSGWAAAANMSGNDALLTSDVAHLRAGIARHELKAVRTACEAFSADASTADGELPAPDQTLTNELNTAYEDDYRAGLDCYRAPSFSSPPFRRFQSELSAGVAELHRAEARYEAVTGGPPPAGSSGASGGT